jgi:hypothetical protein
MDTATEYERLKSLWVYRLYREYQDICWYYRVQLKTPMICIQDMTTKWGEWNPFNRTISINLKLVREYSWDVVLEILKHEMAHQYVSEFYPGVDVSPHGPQFQEGCRKFGVASWAVKASGEIPDRIATLKERVMGAEETRLLDKVEKLLSLASSCNEHEAALAVAKVREIYAKYNLDQIKKAQFKEAMDSLFLTRGKKKTDSAEAKILGILNDHFRVRVIHTRLYNAKKCEQHVGAEILGRRENIIMAEYVYHFLNQQIESLWISHRKKSRCAGALKRSYQLGVLSGFDMKLKESAKIDRSVAAREGLSSGEVSALIKIESSHLDDYVQSKYPRISFKTRVGARINSGAFHSGESEGRSLNINRPLASSNGFGGFLS